ncbi:hypothetical protein Taro_016225 [Colocasia esculenta]|uniref:Uncharacterized protein n=1 Tax=Colocasia esculenta TaxID=4460 RepID=A0A843UJQ0_COLES|nr:hypothetical protein [Colocasia esculenta]
MEVLQLVPKQILGISLTTKQPWSSLKQGAYNTEHPRWSSSLSRARRQPTSFTGSEANMLEQTPVWLYHQTQAGLLLFPGKKATHCFTSARDLHRLGGAPWIAKASPTPENPLCGREDRIWEEISASSWLGHGELLRLINPVREFICSTLEILIT